MEEKGREGNKNEGKGREAGEWEGRKDKKEKNVFDRLL